MQNICSNPAKRCIESLHLHVFSLYLMCTERALFAVSQLLSFKQLVTTFATRYFFCFISSITQYVYDLFTALYVHVNERRKCVNPLSDVITHVFHFFCLMVTYTIIRNESIRQYTDQLIRLNIICCIPDDPFSILSNSKQYELFKTIAYSYSLSM